LREAGEVKEEDEEAFVAERGLGGGFELVGWREGSGRERGGRRDGDGGEDFAAQLLVLENGQGDGFAVFEDTEVVLSEAADGFAVLALDGDVDDDELGAGFELELLCEEGGKQEQGWEFGHVRTGT
jgi:hypothetical protein